ncbi:DUF1931 family protein, partial [Streptomyces sp. C1-2]|uniref:DUF1931 family protein n=1 Tax=Streptomyces sp. C1-2 TaxID=2720022 RepID=UPI001F0D2DE8
GVDPLGLGAGAELAAVRDELAQAQEQLASHPALDRTPDEETEAAYPDIVGGLSLALGRSFKILHPDLKNPQTQHWDEARAVFDLLL